MPRFFGFYAMVVVTCLSLLAFTQVRADENTSYPIVIKHALGTTTIAKKPERVATDGLSGIRGQPQQASGYDHDKEREGRARGVDEEKVLDLITTQRHALTGRPSGRP